MFYAISAILSIALIYTDQLSKFLALKKIAPLGSITVIKKILDFTFVKNYGAAFGILQNARPFFIILTLIALIAILYYYFSLPRDKYHNSIRLCLLFIFSGAFGNFIDRIKNGYVIDFIEFTFIDFPVFNWADVYLTLGITILFIISFKHEKKIKK